MRNRFLWVFLFTASLFGFQRLHAQEDTTQAKPRYTQAYIDSLLKDEGLIKELNHFIDSIKQPKSMLLVAIGGGNGFFTARNATTATGFNSRLFTMPSVSYYHKSGFGISGAAYATSDNNETVFYQGVLTPSFDIVRDDWGIGISYSRYFNNDSVSFALNPLKNDVFLYGVYKKTWLQPGLALDYSFATYKETELEVVKQSPLLVRKHDYKIHAADFSMIATLQHDFNWYGIFHHNDHITFTTTAMVLAATQNYQISTMNRLRQMGAVHSPQPVFASAENSVSGSSAFSVQSFGALFNGTYSIGHLLLQPQVMGNYLLNTNDGVRSFHTSFLMTVGLVF